MPVKRNDKILELITFILETLSHESKATRLQLEKKGRELGITDKREVKELTELSVLLYARKLIEHQSTKAAYALLVDLYKRQPNSSYRSSTVEIYRQYSTPLPISYLLGLFVKGNNLQTKTYLEPSAGNGLLTIGLPPTQTHVNELDKLRVSSLKRGGFKKVINEDAFDGLEHAYRIYDGVIANPPFGKLEQEYRWKNVPIYFRDHIMILKALEAMKDNGRAAFVTGKHLQFDSKGRITRKHGRAFFSLLFNEYNVLDLIPIDGNALYARQGTGFDTMLILVDGRNKQRKGYAPTLKNFNENIISDFKDLYKRISKHLKMKPNHTALYHLAERLKQKIESSPLGAPYTPTSEGCIVLNTEVPDNMAYEIHDALAEIKKKVGGDLDNFVRHRLGYSTKTELCKALSAEQTDAVAMAIYNIEAKNQGCIIGDQTGIGKGRIAASLVRYAYQQGFKPIFLTEKPNLFSDLYRDLIAIGSPQLVPFIVNSRASKTNIKNPNGDIIFKAQSKSEQQEVFEKKDLAAYDLVMATYSQFNAAEDKNGKKTFLETVAKGSIIVMDESHNASGKHSNTGLFFQKVVRETKATIFLSATFAKQPANMPLYALKTAISDANMTPEALTHAIESGGIALQEIISSQLVAEGQMIRRERSYEGIDITYQVFHEKKQEHFAMADNVTKIMRDIIAFQENHISPLIEDWDKRLAKINSEVRSRGGTSELGISNLPYFSKIFNVINQMLLAINATDVADLAIKALKEGKKPIITVASTMESFLNQLVNELEISPGDGQKIPTDFALILQNGLDGVMRYTEVDEYEQKHYGQYTLADLPILAQAEYLRISGHIEDATTGLQLSPIDLILERIQAAGYSIHEVTGRTLKVNYTFDLKQASVERRKKINVNDAYLDFNNNDVDALLINQSGGTGASGHAIPTTKVPISEVKPRVMINAQPELDINKVVQLLGRIHRTGQIHLPSFVFAMSAIPAQSRLMSMMMIKLKSLNANTSSNQNRDKEMMNFPDFINKYGDRVVRDYLSENPQMKKMLGSPNLEGSGGEVANRVAGRVAILSTRDQQSFYSNIVTKYDEYIDILRQTGEYDLEMEELPLKAKTLSKKIFVLGRGGASRFGADTFTEKLEVNALKKPFTVNELKQQIEQTLKDLSPSDYARELLEKYDLHTIPNYERDKGKIEHKFNRLLDELKVKPSLWKIHEKEGEAAYEEAYKAAKTKLTLEKEAKLKAIETRFRGNKQRFYGLVKFFRVGRALTYLLNSFSEPAFATFLGFDINEKSQNPYAPSAIKLRFAIASTQKYIVYPASYEIEINAIKGASVDSEIMNLPQMFIEWERRIKDKLQDRVTRYMRTGNILQAGTDGKLVSYTTDKGKVKKGLLLPEKIQLKNFDTEGIVIPLNRAHRYVLSHPIGKAAILSNELSILNQGDYYRILLPSSHKKGGKFFMNEELINLTVEGKFEKIGTTMRGNILPSKMKNFLNILDKMGVNIQLKLHEFEVLEKEVVNKTNSIKAIKKPPKEIQRVINFDQLKLLQLKMKMKLKLNRAA